MAILSYSKAKHGGLAVSTHFRVGEFACPVSDSILVDNQLVALLEQMITRLGAKSCTIISGYRTPAYSVKVGGYATDQHTKGTASDVQFKRADGSIISGKTVCCVAQDLGFGGIGYISETSTHLDVRTGSKWRGDEKTGKSLSDFYSYFGIVKAQPVKVLGITSKVKINTSATVYATGEHIPTNVKGVTYTVKDVKTDRVLIKEIMSWVYKKDVTVQ